MKDGLPSPGGLMWANGAFLPVQEGSVSILDRGLLYGDGLFETMRAQNGRVLFLARHVERLVRSMAFFRMGTAGLPDWGAVLPELLLRNGLSREVAVVKILVTRGLTEGVGMPATDTPCVLVTARPYTPPSEGAYAEGWRLTVCRDGFAPPLAMHKSLNYLYYLSARQSALDKGADEAVILDRSGRVAETAAGSLLFCIDGVWYRPDSPYQLPGITVGEVCEEMLRAGRRVEPKSTDIKDLRRAETVYVLNSLMLVMPVRSVDGHRILRPTPDLAERLRARLLARG